MNKEKSKIILVIVSIVIGIIIIFAPVIITGRFYDEVHVMGGLLVGDFLMRTTSLILGLIIIYDGIKNYFKS
jgi:ABC-type arginine/histidine transport system permease subunit